MDNARIRHLNLGDEYGQIERLDADATRKQESQSQRCDVRSGMLGHTGG